tara:strand:+ start:464 stop:829 length:366 start_codon:yes stop_codon:yes gene_type:complete
MIKLKSLLLEFDYLKSEIDNAKKIFKQLQKMYSDIPKFKLEFKDLKGRGSGYLTTSKIKGGKHIFIDKMTIDSSGMSSFPADYAVCHEFAHAILAVTKGSLAHSKIHDNLTYKLAKKFGLV